MTALFHTAAPYACWILVIYLQLCMVLSLQLQVALNLCIKLVNIEKTLYINLNLIFIACLT
jgi:hypothetical protein